MYCSDLYVYVTLYASAWLEQCNDWGDEYSHCDPGFLMSPL